MTAVGVLDGIKYGFVMLGYFVAVFVVGAVLIGIGGAVGAGGTGGNDVVFAVVGGLLALVGGLVVLAGSFGVLYKIIADGARRGVESANEAAPDPSPDDTTGPDQQ